MALRVICPKCKAKLKFERSVSGRVCTCPKCDTRFRVNDASGDSAAEDSPNEDAPRLAAPRRVSPTAAEPWRRQRFGTPAPESESGIKLSLPEWNLPGWTIYAGAATAIALVLSLLVWVATGRSSKPEIQVSRLETAAVEQSAEPSEQPSPIVPENRTRQPAPMKTQSPQPVVKSDPSPDRAGTQKSSGSSGATPVHPGTSLQASGSAPPTDARHGSAASAQAAGMTPAQSSPEIGRLSDILPGEIDSSVAAIVDDFQEKAAAFTAEKLKTTDDAKLRLLLARDPAKSYASKLLEAGEKEPKSASGFQRFVAVLYVVRESDPELTGDIVARASNHLVADHIGNAKLGKVALLAARMPHPAARRFLEALADKSAQREVRGLACYALLANLARERNDVADRRALNKINKQVAALSRRIDGQEFGDVSVDDQPLTEAAKSLLEQARQKGKCTRGSMAPEIAGRDLDGARLRLSDYRGKVVMLEFWASWCPYCRKLFPYEKDLVKKMRGRPFALLGVNVDKKATAATIGRKRLVSWRSFQDGPNGPIGARWGVTGYPQFFILDHTGKIRYSGYVADASYYTKVVEDLLGAPELKNASVSENRAQAARRFSDRN